MLGILSVKVLRKTGTRIYGMPILVPELLSNFLENEQIFNQKHEFFLMIQVLPIIFDNHNVFDQNFQHVNMQFTKCLIA